MNPVMIALRHKCLAAGCKNVRRGDKKAQKYLGSWEKVALHVPRPYSVQGSRGYREIAHCRSDGREILLGWHDMVHYIRRGTSLRVCV